MPRSLARCLFLAVAAWIGGGAIPNCNCPGQATIDHHTPIPSCLDHYETQWTLLAAGRCHIDDVCNLAASPCKFRVTWVLHFNSPPCTQVETVLNGWDSATVQVDGRSTLTVGRVSMPSCTQGATVDLNVDGTAVSSVTLNCGQCPG